MHDGLPWGESPIDQEADTQLGLGWASSVIFLGSAILLVLNAHAIANWANQLEITPRTAPLITAAENWHSQVGEFGLNVPVDGVKLQAQKLREAKWRSASSAPQASRKAD